MGTLGGTPVVETPPAHPQAETSQYSHRSIETLVVVLAVITIIGVIAGMIARLCGGRHGENDIEGFVERKCRSCIDGGVTGTAAAEKEELKPEPNLQIAEFLSCSLFLSTCYSSR